MFPVLRAIAGALIVLVASALVACGPRPAPYGADVVAQLAGGDAGYERVMGPRPLRFPEDEGQHPDHQTEWWYYTGNLADADGRRFGFQLTFFRRALAPAAPDRASAWGTRQLMMAHLAVTDVEAATFHSAERFARGAAGLAGAQAEPYRVWLGTWVAEEAPDGAVRLAAADGPVALDLDVRPEKPRALHGLDGFSPKGPEPGNASLYYSYTRLGATGRVVTAAGAFDVTGTAWMDHEWSTSALAADRVGWDWFSLQLDDGRELMLFHIRGADGELAPESSGSLVDTDGTVRPLARDDFALAVRDTWASPRSGGVYPAGWRVTVPAAGLELEVEPLVADQELDVSFKYWEGAVRVTGRAGRSPVAGHGYVELTGYAPVGAGLPGRD